jgi:glycerophosphoryl diester phosphodiesterase
LLRSRPDRLAELIARPYAHRGLHGPGVPENSRGAFEAAIAAGHGIELDVQASRDGQALVIHDYQLDRLTEGIGPICGMVAAELEKIRLRDCDETIPSLAEVLKLIAGRAPLLIEAKSPGRRVSALSRAVLANLTGYTGPVAVMSFNPEIGRWFARRAPWVLRGLVVTEAGRRWRGRIMRHFARRRAKPDFLAYDIRDLPSRFAAAQRARGLPVLTWTCRTDEQRARAAAHADQIIYEVPATPVDALPDPKTGLHPGSGPGQAFSGKRS